MKIAILTHNISTYSQQRMSQLAKERGHEMRFIHLSYCYTNVGATAPIVHYREDETLEDIDAIIPRIHSKHSFYGTAILRQFERMGIFSLNSSISITWSLDKLRTLQQLAKKSIPMPNTGFADAPEETGKLIELVGDAPLIVKLINGAEGKGTVFAETYQAAISVINAFKQLKTHILVQEYIEESAGCDIRCIVVGNEVIGALQRHAKEAGFRTGYRFLSHSHAVKLTAAEKKLAIKTARTMKLNFATVDIIRSHRGPLILDVDPSPNIEALEKTTKLNIIRPILEFLESHVKKND